MMTKYKKQNSALLDWLKLLDGHPMNALDEVKDALYYADVLYQETNEDVIAFMSECIRKAKSSPLSFLALEGMSVFDGDEIGPRKLSVRVGRYVLDVSTGSSTADYERARSYGQLAYYLSESDMNAERIANYVHRHGIRASLDHFIKEERNSKAQEIVADSDGGKIEGDPLSGKAIQLSSGLAGADTAKPPLTRGEFVKRALSREPSSKPARPKLDLGKMLVAEASDRLLCDVLETAVGDDVTITLRREPSLGGQDWKRFVIQEIID